MPEVHIEIEAEDGCLDGFVIYSEGPGRRPPILLLSGRGGVTREVEALGRRLCAHGYFVLAPDWVRRPAEERREDADAWLDFLAGERRVDDTRVGVVGCGAGADLALRVAAWRSERIAAVAAYGGRGVGPATARDMAQRINGVVRLGLVPGASSVRLGRLERAFCETGINFDVEICLGEPDWDGLVDLFDRTLPAAQETRLGGDPAAESTTFAGTMRGS